MIIEKINDIRLVKNNLNKDDLDILLNYAKNVDESFWNKNQDDNKFWSGRYIHYNDVENDEVKKVMISLMSKISKVIQLEYNIDKPVYSDLLQFVRWPVGVELKPHCDKEEPNGKPHPFPFRDWGSITYLNVDEYEGHISCNSASKSEIVLPVRNNKGNIEFILDIDSSFYGEFNREDANELQKIVYIIETQL